MQVNGLSLVSYQHDGNARLRQITQGPQTATLTYDEANRRSSLTLPNGITVAYTYHDASRLISQTYTGLGGPVGDLTYSYDANEQLAFGAVSQTFDDNGNLQTQTDASGTTTYTSDARNRLVGIIMGDAHENMILPSVGCDTFTTMGDKAVFITLC